MTLSPAQVVSRQQKTGSRRGFIIVLSLCMLLAGTLTGCGFQLRGALTLSQDISPLYLQHNNAFELAREVTALLKANNITISEFANTANSRLNILSESRQQSLLSVDSSGRVTEYRLTYTVRFNIKIGQQEATEELVTISRSLLFDPDAVLAVSNEAEVIYKDMNRDAARLMLLKLQARAQNLMMPAQPDSTGATATENETQ